MDLALILNNLVKKSHRIKTLVSDEYIGTQYDTLLIDTRNKAFTVQLPYDPAIGSRVIIFDVGGNLHNNNIAVRSQPAWTGPDILVNGHIDYLLQGSYNLYQAVYYNIDKGWRITASIALPDNTNASGTVIGASGGSGISGGCCEPLVDTTPEIIYSLDNDIVMSL